MKRNRLSAFTLIEMLTVIAIIAVIASLVVAVAGLVNKKGGIARAEGEIHTLTASCESYKADNGVYPQNEDTDELDPRKDAVPTTSKYQKSSLYLYSQLSGDAEPAGEPDGKPEATTKVYFPFKPDVLSADKDGNGKIKKVKYIQDPFGQCYGYSTAAAKAEAEYLAELRKKPGTKRKSKTPGYNAAAFDIWSTGGTTTKTASQNSSDEVDQARWVKNW
ncbi:type II secretion system protein [Verrucomicrobiota bacterium sgz303538]